MQDERIVALDLDQLGEILHRLADVDVRAPGVVKDAELAIRMSTLWRAGSVRVERVERDAARLDLARIVRSESTIGALIYARALKETRHGADLRIALDDPVGDQLEELAALIVQ